MKISVMVNCDYCMEDITFTFEADKNKFILSNLRKQLLENNWHYNTTICLCPSCKEKVGDNDCLHCKHRDVKYSTNVCGLLSEYDEVKVFKGDTCTRFEKV